MATATMTTTICILTLDPDGRTTFPQGLREELGLDEDTQLRVVRCEDGAIELIPARLIDVDQLWYHSAEGRARIRAGEADFTAGRSTAVRTESEVLSHLDALKVRRS